MVASADSSIVVAQPRQPVGLLLSQADEILKLKLQFKKGVHYGAPYPGSKKDTLLKPGAELLARRFGLRPRYEQLQGDVVINWDQPERHYIIYRYRCVMIDIVSGAEVGEAIGSCNSLEEKYRFRNTERVCPQCGKTAIIKGKKEFGGGWLCFKAKDGCGAKFKEGDPAIENQEVGKTVNLNPFDIANTIDKMAQKRAMNSSVLVATGASSYFAPGDEEVNDLYANATDDIEVVDTSFEVVDDAGTFPDDIQLSAQPQPAQRQQQQKQGNYSASKQTSSAPVQAKNAPSSPAKSTQAAAPSTVTEVTPGEPVKIRVFLKSVERRMTSGNKPYLSFVTSDGKKATAWSRQQFIDGLWIEDTDWKNDGLIPLDPMIPVTIVQDGDYWKVESVEPMAAPTDAPAQPKSQQHPAFNPPKHTASALWFEDKPAQEAVKLATGFTIIETARQVRADMKPIDFADADDLIGKWRAIHAVDDVPF